MMVYVKEQSVSRFSLTGVILVSHGLLFILDDLSVELKRLNLWQREPPAPEAFTSTVPFFTDTMAFHEWLQFVLIPRMTTLIDEGHSLPDKVAIAPMAEEVYRNKRQEMKQLIEIINDFDGWFNREPKK